MPRVGARRSAATLACAAVASLAYAVVSSLVLGGCESPHPIDFFDGGVGRSLVILDPPGSQIGLRYGTSIELDVRYTEDDAMSTPIAGEPVVFAIFDDPLGSTLSRDSVKTDDSGLATVTVTAGNQEDSFRVRATAAGAAYVDFSVSISKLEFVELDAVLRDPLPSPGGRTLLATLHTDHACADIVPSATDDGAVRTITRTATAQGTLAFVNLLSRTYAVVGRVEDGGHLLAFGCLDVDISLAPPGAHLHLPIAMHAIEPVVTGDFDLATELGTSRAGRSDALFVPFDVLDRCDGHLGQLLLDALVTRVSPARAVELEALRGAVAPSVSGLSTVSCRPAMVGAQSSLDAELDALLEASTTPGAERALLVGDLDAILASATLASRLSLSPTSPLPSDGPAAPTRLVGVHTARTVTLSLGSTMRSDDLIALGYPVVAVTGIDVGYSAGLLTIGSHALPLALPALWGDAFETLGVAVRLPTLMDTSTAGWITATVAAAAHGGQTGCAAIEALLCERTDPAGCAGSIVGPCADATAAVGAQLADIFATSSVLTLRGVATAVDTDQDLVSDHLTPGSWTATGSLSAALSFSGQRATP